MIRPFLRGVEVPGIGMYEPFPYGTKGGVASNEPLAAKAGLEMLKHGGNAFDAACAASLVLSVVEPHHSGIGGGCFQVFYHKESNQVFTVDARGVAPLAATEDMFLDENGDVDPNLTEYSGRPVAVPALYRAMDDLLKKYGTMTWEQVSAPAIKLAREGFPCGFVMASATETDIADHNRDCYEGFSEYYLKDGKPLRFGEIVKLPDLADTMEQVAKNGVDWFYNGPVADDIVAVVQKNKGVLQKEDLVNCAPKAREAVRGTYRGYEIASMAPPSSGGSHIIQMLNIFENFDIGKMGFHSADTIHVMAETMKMMYADRSVAMGDPDFVQVQMEKIISKEYAKELAAKIDMTKAQDFAPTAGIEAKEYPGCTTNFSIMDQFGNAISQTQTVRNWWGCGVVVKGRGFLMNNTMADFSPKVGVKTSQGLSYGEANAVRLGKTPLSSMSPTLVLKDGEPFLAVGAAGGGRIITGTLQVIMNAIDFGMSMSMAVKAPQLCCLSHEQTLELEPGFSPDSIKILAERGHKITDMEPGTELLLMPNGVMQQGGVFFPAGTSRTDCGSGVLTEFGTCAVEGIQFVDA